MPENTLTIKQLGVADAPALQQIAVQAYSDHYLDTWKDNGTWYVQTFFNRDRLMEELQEPGARFYLVSDPENPIGFLKLNTGKPLPGSFERAVELERIYLIKEASGNGYGTRLMQFVFDIAHQEKARLVWLKVMDTSPAAVRFYEKMGFVNCGTHQVPFEQKKDDMRGMYIMQKVLD